jgi:hypothetical protein
MGMIQNYIFCGESERCVFTKGNDNGAIALIHQGKSDMRLSQIQRLEWQACDSTSGVNDKPTFLCGIANTGRACAINPRSPRVIGSHGNLTSRMQKPNGGNRDYAQLFITQAFFDLPSGSDQLL